jgi:hypothetical protein
MKKKKHLLRKQQVSPAHHMRARLPLPDGGDHSTTTTTTTITNMLTV